MVRVFAALRRLATALGIAALAVAAVPTLPGDAASLEAVRVGAHDTYTRIVLDTSTSLAPRITRPSPTTIHLTLPAVPNVGLAGGGGLVRAIDVARSGDEAVLELTLSRPGRVRQAFALAPGDGPWHRYVVDVEADPAAAPEPAPTPPAAAPKARDTGVATALRVRVPVPAVAAPTRRPTPGAMAPRRRPAPTGVVVIDPGHGGRDPGAIGRSGLQEKTVTLAVARRLAAKLAEVDHLEVVLTRDRDVGVRLADRRAMAAAHEADLFLSLHADSLPAHPSVRGASVYTLSAQASDPDAARKAREENAADERLDVIATAPDPTVRTILISLMRNSTARRSLAFAHTLASDLAEIGPMLNRPQRSANFVVLRSLNTPSVLVELGYLSNADDEAALADPIHREALADALFHAVTAYFERR